MKAGKRTKIWHRKLSNIQKCVIGDDCTIHSHVWIGDNVRIGNRVKVQAFTFIPDGVDIHDDVFIGPRVTFTNDADLAIKGRTFWAKTVVKSGAKIGAGACILAGVVIGKNAKIGMGAVVIDDVPDNEVWVGNPARKIK